MSNLNNAGLAAVTGATGFLGATLCRKLLEEGRSVRAIYRNPQKLDSLEGLAVEKVRADIRNEEEVRAAFDGVDIVYHVAALFREQGVPPLQKHG